MSSKSDLWPNLPWNEWQDTAATLHMWTQIVGKTRLALSPPLNHWWNVALYVSPRGLTTSLIPYGAEGFDVEFDFIEHRLLIRTSWGETRSLALQKESVAQFYDEYSAMLKSLGIKVDIWATPVEVSAPIPFQKDQQHASYDPDYVHRFWRILLQADEVFKRFRGGFLGKASPVHFFWGSFDLAVSRFAGRRAPERPGADLITREAYSHELISAGFWPGNGGFNTAAFYSYAAPEPPRFADASVLPAAAYYDKNLKEFILKYDDVRTAAEPEKVLMEFLESTYDAGARLAHWDRDALERPIETLKTGTMNR
jgi:hypothetical protein